MIGKICKCKQGKIGIVTGMFKNSGPNWTGKDRSVLYRGINIYNGCSWQSLNPEVIAGSMDEYLEILFKEKK